MLLAIRFHKEKMMLGTAERKDAGSRGMLTAASKPP